MRTPTSALLLFVACATPPSPVPASGGGAGSPNATARAAVMTVRPGIETFLSDVPERLRGKRVGLITNQSGIDASGTPDIDLIARHKDLKLVTLLTPEHGIRGNVEAGEKISDEIDPKTGVTIHSLYGAGRGEPTPEMLKDVDVSWLRRIVPRASCMRSSL